jgi:allophanate hydrolase subunit 2
MMADHPTTGGYPSIGVICRADQPLAAQAEPGSSLIRFAAIGVPAAHQKLATARQKIDEFEEPQEDLWMNL